MEKCKISAGIILFSPKIDRLRLNIDTIVNDVERIYVYNNGASEKTIEELSSNHKILVLGTGENIGIASAMNVIMEAAEKNGDQWVVTYDQDSISDVNLVHEYRNVIAMHLNKVAIICPQVIDERRKYISADKTNEIESVSRCITSASCTNVEAWHSIGGFDDYLFIDLVDNDFCKRLKLNDWDIIKLHNVILNQEFGDIELKKTTTVEMIMKISNFVKNELGYSYLADNIGKLSYKKNVSPIRVYYTNRNVIYLNKKFKNYGGIGYDCYKCKSYLGFQICFNLASIVRGKNKFQIFKAIISGTKDGIKSQIIPLP